MHSLTRTRFKFPIIVAIAVALALLTSPVTATDNRGELSTGSLESQMEFTSDTLDITQSEELVDGWVHEKYETADGGTLQVIAQAGSPVNWSLERLPTRDDELPDEYQGSEPPEEYEIAVEVGAPDTYPAGVDPENAADPLDLAVEVGMHTESEVSEIRQSRDPQKGGEGRMAAIEDGNAAATPPWGSVPGGHYTYTFAGSPGAGTSSYATAERAELGNSEYATRTWSTSENLDGPAAWGVAAVRTGSIYQGVTDGINDGYVVNGRPRYQNNINSCGTFGLGLPYRGFSISISEVNICADVLGPNNVQQDRYIAEWRRTYPFYVRNARSAQSIDVFNNTYEQPTGWVVRSSLVIRYIP